MELIRAESNRVPGRKQVDRVAREQLDVADQGVRELLAGVGEQIRRAAAARARTRSGQAGSRATAKWPVDDARSPSHPGVLGIAAADHRHGLLRGAITLVAPVQQIGDLEPEVLGGYLQSAERHAATMVRKRGQRRGRDGQSASLPARRASSLQTESAVA